MIEFAARRMDRVIATTRLEFTRRLNSLAAIAQIALLLGLFSTVLNLIQGLHDIALEQQGFFSESVFDPFGILLPLGLGLLIAIPALWVHHYLRTRAENLHIEMRNAAAELLNNLR